MGRDATFAWYTRLGILSGLASAGLLGLTPIFGKLAMRAGVAPMSVVALRTGLAALLMLAGILAFRRSSLYIYPAGLLGCLLAGSLNGFGSLLYYLALGRLEVSLASMLYALYPVFVAAITVWGQADSQAAALSRLTVLRLGLALPAVVLLTGAGAAQVDWAGAGLMLGASLFYALHLIANQQVLYDMPAPTVTLYTFMAMALVVVPAHLLFIGRWQPGPADRTVWLPILGLTGVTLLSRLAVFFGVKRLGGVQTSMLGLGELIVSLVIARFWLGEQMTGGQWAGSALLLFSLALVKFEPPQTHMALNFTWLRWIKPPKPKLPPEVESLLGTSQPTAPPRVPASSELGHPR